MTKRCICVVVHSRANYARIKSVMQALKNDPDITLRLVVGGSSLLKRFGHSASVIEDDGFRIDHIADFSLESDSVGAMARSTALGIIELTSVFEMLKPDVVVTVADRYETLATAVAATYLNICLAHTQGGEVSGNIDEKVRHSISKLADIHFPATKEAEKVLIDLGESPDSIYCCGCPAMDLLTADFNRSEVEQALQGGVGVKICPDDRYILACQHPVTSEIDENCANVINTILALEELSRAERIKIIWLWPNSDSGNQTISSAIRKMRESGHLRNFRFFINFEPEIYAAILSNALCTVGNSSSSIREACFLGIPAVNIGTRQKNRFRGENVLDVEYKKSAIINAVKEQIQIGRFPPNFLFGDGSSGEKIADVLKTVPLKSIKNFYDK